MLDINRQLLEDATHIFNNKIFPEMRSIEMALDNDLIQSINGIYQIIETVLYSEDRNGNTK